MLPNPPNPGKKTNCWEIIYSHNLLNSAPRYTFSSSFLLPVKTSLLMPLECCWQQLYFKYIRLYKLPLIRLKRRYMAFKSHPKSHPYINPEFSGISAEKRKNILVYMSLSWVVERGRFRAFISLKRIQNFSKNIFTLIRANQPSHILEKQTDWCYILGSLKH